MEPGIMAEDTEGEEAAMEEAVDTRDLTSKVEDAMAEEVEASRSPSRNVLITRENGNKLSKISSALFARKSVSQPRNKCRHGLL